MMMCLGQFVFSLHTLAFQELQRQTEWRHASNARVGARPASQFLGVGDDTMTLQGVILPEFGARAWLDDLHEMADTGAAWPLVDGTGRVYGQWVINAKQETGTLFTRTGQPTRMDFTVTLRRVDDNIVEKITERSA
ncbi:phage tail protein [Hydrogenophaga sp.]|uniref:phage tail protein n=1 Tax=Hydrogenophaga sp. TaxID=1904254 RepID=UPI003F72A1B3